MNVVHSPTVEDVLVTSKPFFSGRTPLPPSPNQAYKLIHTQNGMRVGPTPELDQFKQDASLTLSQAVADWVLIEAIQTSKRKVPLAVQLSCYFPTEWKRDLDGVIKYVIDAAFARMGLNDNQVVSVKAEKLVDATDPRVEIVICCVVR